jgi:hypothetical protein
MIGQQAVGRPPNGNTFEYFASTTNGAPRGSVMSMRRCGIGGYSRVVRQQGDAMALRRAPHHPLRDRSLITNAG